MKLNIICPLFGTSGYVNHSRGLINCLKEHDIKISTQLIPQWERHVTDFELESIKKTDDQDRINLIIDLPHNWPSHLRKKNNIGFLVFEGDRIPLSWIENIKDSRVNQVWVPSNHVLEAIKNTINYSEDKSWQNQQLIQKIKIVPHGYDPNVFKPLYRKLDVFTFCINKGFRNELDRGGVQYALRAFLEEFNKGEARLIVKINLAYAMSVEEIQKIITRYINEIGKPVENIPEILLIYDNLLPEQLNEIYNNCNVYLNPTRGEAFSLPSLEALACGKPVICTNFGGQTDFLNDSNSWLIDYELSESNELLYEGIKWATPNLVTLKRLMRESINQIDYSSLCLRVAMNWTWDNTKEKANRFLKELG